MKRYTVTADFYIHAENDKEAIKQAEEWKEQMREIHDNQAAILSLHETPFAALIARKISFE